MPAPYKDRGSQVLGAGMTMAVTVALFSYGGYWLDGRLGTLPLFLILGVLLGSAGGFIHLLQAVAPDVLPFGKNESKGREPRDPDDRADSPNNDG